MFQTQMFADRTFQEVEYLKKSLGPVLVAALAEICIRRPPDPVEYLGHWLLRWRYNEEIKKKDIEEAMGYIKSKQLSELQMQQCVKDEEAAAGKGNEECLPSEMVTDEETGEVKCVPSKKKDGTGKSALPRIGMPAAAEEMMGEDGFEMEFDGEGGEVGRYEFTPRRISQNSKRASAASAAPTTTSELKRLSKVDENEDRISTRKMSTQSKLEADARTQGQSEEMADGTLKKASLKSTPSVVSQRTKKLSEQTVNSVNVTASGRKVSDLEPLQETKSQDNGQKRPSLPPSERKQSLAGSENKLSVAGTEKKPSTVNSEKRNSVAASERKPSAGMTEPRMSLASTATAKKPSLAGTEIRPSVAGSVKRLSAASRIKKPSLPVTEAKPSLVPSEKKPSIPTAS